MAFRCVLTTTNLARTLNGYSGVVLHMTIFAATIDRALDKGISVDGHTGLRSQAKRLNILQIFVYILLSKCGYVVIFYDVANRLTPWRFVGVNAFVWQ